MKKAKISIIVHRIEYALQFIRPTNDGQKARAALRLALKELKSK